MFKPTHDRQSGISVLMARCLQAALFIVLVGSVARAQSTPIAMVQHAGTDAGTTTSSALAFPASNTAGNWIAVVIRAGQIGQAFTVTDTSGNTYRKAIQFNETVDGTTLSVFYAENIRGGGNSITVSDTIAGGALRFAILEYAGVATANSLDVVAAAQGTSSSPATSTATTTASGDLVLGVLSTADGETFTAGSGYAIQQVVPAAPNAKLAVEDRIQPTAGPISAGGTLNASDVWSAAMASFRAASGTTSPAPTITSVNPISGATGTPVTIAGTNFGASQGASTVTFNGTMATPTSWAASSITAPVPAGATTGAIVVTVGGVASNGRSFTVTAAAPTITSVNPTSGAAGTPVTISGTNFGASQGASTVTFNGTAATPTSWSSSRIVAPVPTGAATGPVVVTVGGVASNGVGFTVTYAAGAITLTQVRSLDAGTTTSASLAFSTTNTAGNLIAVAIRAGSPGQVFRVTDASGNSYQEAIQVNNGTDDTLAIYYAQNIAGGANTVTVSDATLGTLRIAILEYAGLAASSALDATAAAHGSGTVASSGSATTTAAGDLLLGIVATADTPGFAAGSGYTIEASVPAAPGAKLIAEDAVQAVAGSASAGATLQASNGWAAALAAFRMASQGNTGPPPTTPRLTNLTPSSGTAGTPVTIAGANFGSTQGTSTITFNGTIATPTSWSSSRIVAPVPGGAATGPVVVTVGGAASNGLDFAVTTPAPSITSLSPTSGSVGTPVTIAGTNFGATQGASTVTFNGTTATPTNWSASSITAPVPFGATTGPVIVTVGGVASNGGSFTVTTSGITAVPGFVQQVLVQSNENFERGNGFIIALPNPVLSGNCVIVAITYARAANRTVAISDNMGTNTWSRVAGPFNDPGGTFSSAIYVSSNTTAGTQSITVTFDAALDDFQAVISEWYNVATASALDGGAVSTSVSSPNVTAGTLSTTQSNDLVYQYGIDTAWGVGLEGASFSGFTAGAGFTLLAADRRIGVVHQYAIPSTSGAITPTFKTTGGTSDSFSTLAIALKSAGAGTAPDPAAMRIVSTYHTRVNSGTPSVNFPSIGNLLVMTTAYDEGQETLQSVSDSNGNGWAVVTGNQDPQMAYAKNATPGSTLVLTLDVVEHGSGNLQLLIYDVVNADPNPLVKTAYAAGTAGTGNPVVSNAPTLTPQYTNGLVFASLNCYTGPPASMTSPPGVVFDSLYYAGATDLSPQDSGDGYAHVYPQSTSPLNFSWRLSNGGQSTGWAAAAWEFKSAAAGAAAQPMMALASPVQGAPASVTTMATATSPPGSAAATRQIPVTVAVSPTRSAVTTTQSQQFIATVNHDRLAGGVTWMVDGTPSGNAAGGTISPQGVFTPGTTPGSHTVTAVSASNPSAATSVTVTVTDLDGVLTDRNDAARTGQNLREYALSRATVNTRTFGALFSCAVDGFVYAQPLYVANLNVGGFRNMLIVATDHDSVYAFDADDPSCAQIWLTSVLGPGVTNLPFSAAPNPVLQPQTGITSTPVVDAATNTMYVVARTEETVGAGCSTKTPCDVLRLHALDLLTGGEKLDGPVTIAAPGFVARPQMQRPSLVLTRNLIYLAVEGLSGSGAPQEWVFGYDAGTLAPTVAFPAIDPAPASSGTSRSLSQGGAELAADANGNLWWEAGSAPLATSSLSSNGKAGGLVWVLDLSGWAVGTSDQGTGDRTTVEAVLSVYDATDLSTPLYSSPATGTGAAPPAVRFAVPTIANGKVYIGGQNVVGVFGLRPE